MDNIKDFLININISDCNLLYDYGRQEYYHRPADGNWDLAAIRGRSEENLAANQAKTCVHLMDKALTRWGALEADIGHFEDAASHKEDDGAEHALLWRSISDQPSLPKRVMPVYRPGDTVQGHVRLELKEAMEADSVHVTFKGAARVLVRVHHGRGYRDTYGSEKYVEEKTVMWEKSSRTESDVVDQVKLLSCVGDGPDGERETLPAGFNKFPFVYQIPKNARGSCPPIIESYSDFAHILYRLKAVIDKGRRFKRGNIVCGHAVWVTRDYDIATVPHALSPLHAEESLSRLVRSGHVSCKATLPRHAYVRGDVIPLSLVIENTDHLEINAVTARVRLSGTIYPQPKAPGIYRSVSLKSDKVKEGAIPAGSVQQISMKLPLRFDEIDENLLPAGAHDHSPLIEIRYEVVVKLKRRGLHRGVELKIPITIGTKDSSPSSTKLTDKNH